MICGGTPRDKYLKRLDNVSDLDITTGDDSIGGLARETALVLGKKYNIGSKVGKDGHVSIFMGDLKIDFSSNFNAPNIFGILNKMGIKAPTDIEKEMYSRDFTCNSLLMSFDLKSILDPTKRGIQDIQAKRISTCLDPATTLTANKNRVVRAIYLAAKLDFEVDEKIINWVKNNPDSIRFASESSLTEKLSKALKYNEAKTLDLLDKMGLWNYIPISEQLYPHYMKRLKNVKK